MATFPGFFDDRSKRVPLPGMFFTDLLPMVDNLNELKVILFAFWMLSKQEGPLRYFLFEDILQEPSLFLAGGRDAESTLEAVSDGLERAVQHGALLCVKPEGEQHIGKGTVFFINSPRGQAAVQGLLNGSWKIDAEERAPIYLEEEKPNIFALYEENIGPITPLLSDILKEAEQTYPSEWIEDAFRIALTKNIRRWNYIAAILDSWQRDGKNESHRRDNSQDRRRYVSGEFSSLIEH